LRVEILILPRDRSEDTSDSSHEALSCQGGLGVLLLVGIFLSQQSKIGVSQFLAERDSIRGNLAMIHINQVLESFNKLVEVNIIHNLKVGLQQDLETWAAELNCQFMSQKGVHCHSCFYSYWELRVSQIRVDAVENMLKMLLAIR
jgi:hypothetical protein